MDSYFDSFRMNMKYYREKLGLNQSQLTILADSSNGMIGNIESGKAHPSFKTIVSIASALKVHPADLFLRDTSKTNRDIKKKLLQEFSNEIERILDLNLPDGMKQE